MRYFVGIIIDAESEEEAKIIAFDKFYFGEWDELIVKQKEEEK